MRLRNNIFAEAFKWLKKNWEGIRYQKDLAAKIGVSEDTITRIMRDQTEVTDDFLCKFNEAFDNVFNYQWLRGEDAYHMLTVDLINAQSQVVSVKSKEQAPNMPDMSSVFNAALAAKDETIQSLKRELFTKDEYIATLKARIADLERTIVSHNMNDLDKYPYAVGVAEDNKRQSKRR